MSVNWLATAGVLLTAVAAFVVIVWMILQDGGT